MKEFPDAPKYQDSNLKKPIMKGKHINKKMEQW